MKQARADIVIFGGGVAGLWLLNVLRAMGFCAVLFETGTLGGGQTNKSQGIIHGGMKYVLQGVLTQDAQALTDVPNIWKDCLKGKGEINLSGVKVLSEQQYLWSPNKVTAKLAGFLAGATLSSKVKRLEKSSQPSVFQHPLFKGEVFALDEFVLDVPLLTTELTKTNTDAIFKIEPLCEQELKFNVDGSLASATVYMGGVGVEIEAQQFIFTAGSGNEVIINKLNLPSLAMQRRPLHMVAVKLPAPHALYAHCIGLSARPRVTITTHFTPDGSTVWYLGGQLAEEGVKLTSEQQIKETKKELTTLFPWIDFNGAEFSTVIIDRAEPLQKTGLKPEGAYYKAIHNMIVAWPTKLALAPNLAQQIKQHLLKQNLESKWLDLHELRAWPLPSIAIPFWEDAFCKELV